MQPMKPSSIEVKSRLNEDKADLQEHAHGSTSSLLSKSDQSSVVLSSAQLQRQILSAASIKPSSLRSLPSQNKVASMSSASILDPDLVVTAQFDSVSPRIPPRHTKADERSKAKRQIVLSKSQVSLPTTTTHRSTDLYSPRNAINAKQVSANLIRKLIEAQKQVPPAQLPPLANNNNVLPIAEDPPRTPPVKIDILVENAAIRDASVKQPVISSSPSMADLSESAKALIAANENSLEALNKALKRHSPRVFPPLVEDTESGNDAEPVEGLQDQECSSIQNEVTFNEGNTTSKLFKVASESKSARLTPFEALALDARDAAEAWLESRLRHGKWIQALHLAQNLVDTKADDEQIIFALNSWQEHHTNFMNDRIVQAQLKAGSSLSRDTSITKGIHSSSQLHLLMPGSQPVLRMSETAKVLQSTALKPPHSLLYPKHSLLSSKSQSTLNVPAGLKILGIDKQSLSKAGLSNEQIERVYRGLWVYTVGVHDLMKRISYEVSGGSKGVSPRLTNDSKPIAYQNTPHPSSDVLMESLWKVHAVLFELLNAETYPMALVAVERASLNALHSLTTRFHSFAHSRQRRVEALKQEVEYLEETHSSLRQALTELRAEKQSLVDEVVKLGKETVHAALEAAENKQELWRVRHDLTRASEKFIAAEEALAHLAQKNNKQLLEQKKIVEEMREELERKNQAERQEKQEIALQQAYSKQLESDIAGLRLQMEQLITERNEAVRLKDNESARIKTLEFNLEVRAREAKEFAAVQIHLRKELDAQVRINERTSSDMEGLKEQLLSSTVKGEKVDGIRAVREAEAASYSKRYEKMKAQCGNQVELLRNAKAALKELQSVNEQLEEQMMSLRGGAFGANKVSSAHEASKTVDCLEAIQSALSEMDQLNSEDEKESIALNTSKLQLEEESRIRAATAETEYRRDQMNALARASAELEQLASSAGKDISYGKDQIGSGLELSSGIYPIESMQSSSSFSSPASSLASFSREKETNSALSPKSSSHHPVSREAVASQEVNAALNLQHTKLWTQVQELRISLQKSLAQIAELTSSQNRTVSALEREQADHRDTRKTVSNLSSDLQKATNEKSSQVTELSKLRHEKQELEARIESLTHDLSKKEDDSKSLQQSHQKRVKTLEDEIASLQLLKTENQSQSSQASAEIAALRQKNWDMAQSLQQIRGEVDRLTNLLNQARTEINKLTEESVVDKHTLTGLRRALAEKMDELDSIEQHSLELQEKLHGANQASSQRDELLKELEATKAQFEEELANERISLEKRYEATLRDLKEKNSKLTEEKHLVTEELQGKLQVQVHVSSSTMENKLRAMEVENKETVAKLQEQLDTQRDEYTRTIDSLQKSLEQSHQIINSLQVPETEF